MDSGPSRINADSYSLAVRDTVGNTLNFVSKTVLRHRAPLHGNRGLGTYADGPARRWYDVRTSSTRERLAKNV